MVPIFVAREALTIKLKSLPVSGRGISPQCVEGMTHTEKDLCTYALNCWLASKNSDNVVFFFLILQLQLRCLVKANLGCVPLFIARTQYL